MTAPQEPAARPRAAALLFSAALTASLAGAAPAAAQPAPVHVEVTVHADRPGATIDPNVYGQFAEHLGRGIYEGVWVGEGSPIPNTRGYRNDVLAALRALHVPLIRWPGGCFADIYHWRDGIGPRGMRPTTINATWGGVPEPNAFGTHELFDFAELIGAQVYLNANVGTAGAQETADWIEYITSDSHSTLAELRRRNGRERPWRLPFVAVGNETWGCGGNMRAEHYADVYRERAAFLRGPRDQPLTRIASGASGDDFHWTEVLMAQAAPFMDGLSLHYYTLPTGKWDHKGPATGFGEADWIATLKAALHIDDLIARHAAIMDRFDPKKRVGLLVDEWGTWYDPEPGANPAFLNQPNTLRDAIVAALHFGIFHAHADRVRMANIAQMVNVLQSMILTDRERMVLTPTYHVFEMYLPFQGATVLPVDVAAPLYRVGDTAIRAVQVSAARDRAGRMHLALVNVDPARPASVSAAIVGATPLAARGRILTADAMDAENTFAAPDRVRPARFEDVKVEDGRRRIALTLPPKSVLVLDLQELGQ